MQYADILRNLAEKEGVSEEYIEREMQKALIAAGISVSVEEFIASAILQLRKDDI